MAVDGIGSNRSANNVNRDINTARDTNTTRRPEESNRTEGTQQGQQARDQRFNSQNNGLSADGFDRELASGSFEESVSAARVEGSVGEEGSAFYGQGSVDF